MNGLVYSLDDDSDSTPVYWMGVMVAAIVVHALPLFFMTFKTVDPAPMDESFTVTLDDSFLIPLKGADPLVPRDVAESKPELMAPVAPKLIEVHPEPPETVPPPAAVVVEPPPVPKVQLKPASPEAKAELPQPEKKEVAEPEKKRPLKDRDLPTMNPSPDTAFDERPETAKAAPKNAYASDRNSTAADRGPKNLTQGDPYMDKGESNLIRYGQTKRGEGNVAPAAADPNSGSIKIEGAPVPGDGGGKTAKDQSKRVKTAEIPTPELSTAKLRPAPASPTPAEKFAEVAKAPPPEAVKPNDKPLYRPEPATPMDKPAFKAVAGEADSLISEVGKKAAKARVKEVAAQPAPVQLPARLEFEPAKRRSPSLTDPAAQPAEAAADPVRTNSPAQEIGKAIDAQAELERFQAQLNGVNSDVASNGSAGTSGPRLRQGERGHEGNGTPRPGDDNAVSDVTTINLESSATELGDARFAKRFDPKTAYIKAFARRIDGKWKADIHAHLRARLVPGLVSIKIVLRKDGKLLEASESYRNTGVPDEYVATAKRAIEEAAKPSADPFPVSLEDRESIEYTFTFMYQ